MSKNIAAHNVPDSVMQVVRAVIAKEKKGWTVVESTLSVDGDTATVQLLSYPIRKTVCISLEKKTITWSQG